MKSYITKNRNSSIISKFIILAIWVLLSKIVDNEIIIPSIKSTMFSLIDIVTDISFLNTIKSTLLRTLIGFLISLSLAMITGILSNVSKMVYDLMSPILSFLNSIPTIAIIILALIWLRNDFVPMFVGFIMIFPILYETILNSILNIDRHIIQMANLYSVGKLTIIKDIYIPNIFYNLSSILSSVLGMNLKMVIAGEVLSQPKHSIGSSLQLQRMYLNTSGVFAWIVIILFISWMINYLSIGIKYSLKIDKWK